MSLAGFGVCGDFGQGFVQTTCRTCGDELRVPFSRKGRGFCPSCMGRRMAEGAALLVDHMLPPVGYRQWVLSLEGRAAVRLGYDQALLAEVAGALARAVMHDMRWAVKRRHGLDSVEPLHAGVFMVVQRFRRDLGLFVHLHALATDGAFEEDGGALRFLPAPTPTAQRMTAVLAQVHKVLAAVDEDDALDMDPALRACVQLALAGPHLAALPEPAASPHSPCRRWACTYMQRRPSTGATVHGSNGSATTCCARRSPTMPSRPSRTAGCASTSRLRGAAVPPTPT